MGAYEGELVEGLEDSAADISVLEERFHHQQRGLFGPMAHSPSQLKRQPLLPEKRGSGGEEPNGLGTKDHDRSDVDQGQILAGSVVRSALQEA